MWGRLAPCSSSPGERVEPGQGIQWAEAPAHPPWPHPGQQRWSQEADRGLWARPGPRGSAGWWGPLRAGRPGSGMLRAFPQDASQMPTQMPGATALGSGCKTAAQAGCPGSWAQNHTAPAPRPDAGGELQLEAQDQQRERLNAVLLGGSATGRRAPGSVSGRDWFLEPASWASRACSLRRDLTVHPQRPLGLEAASGHPYDDTGQVPC